MYTTYDFFKPCVSSPSHPSVNDVSVSTVVMNPVSPLLSLPPELLLHILEFLPPQTLISLSRTCHSINGLCRNDLLWAAYVCSSVPYELFSPAPCSSWRELYIQHHPFWFLPRYKIWFADKNVGGTALTGSLIIVRYDYRRGCIEGYRLVAEHGKRTFESWHHLPDVIIHTFNPKVQLWLDDPIVKLDLGSQPFPVSSRVRQETKMHTSLGLTSMISLCQPIPSALQHNSMALWPSRILPCHHRVRSESATMFRDEGHKPKNLAEASDQTFRLRRWLGRRGVGGHIGVRMGEYVKFGSISSLTPSKSSLDKCGGSEIS